MTHVMITYDAHHIRTLPAAKPESAAGDRGATSGSRRRRSGHIQGLDSRNMPVRQREAENMKSRKIEIERFGVTSAKPFEPFAREPDLKIENLLRESSTG
jgi:hypothetical protein